MLELISSPVLANIIAFLALLLGLYNLYELMAPLDVEFKTDLDVFPPEKIILFNANSSIKSPVILVGWVKILNPSAKDAAFFDLRAFNPETNMNYGLITKKTFPPDLSETMVQIHVGPSAANQDIPPRAFGSFAAKSFIHFDLLIYPQPTQALGKYLVISFKTSKRTLFRKVPFAISRKKYKFYARSYKIEGLEKFLQDNQQPDTSNNSE